MDWNIAEDELPCNEQEIIFIDKCDQVFHGKFLANAEYSWRPIYSTKNIKTSMVSKWIDWNMFIKEV